MAGLKRGIWLHTGFVEDYYRDMDYCLRLWEAGGGLKILVRDAPSPDDVFYVVEFGSTDMDEMLTTMSNNDLFIYEIESYTLPAKWDSYFQSHGIIRRFIFLDEKCSEYGIQDYDALYEKLTAEQN